MTAIKNWIFGVIIACGILSLCYAVLPKGKFRTILRCSGGLVLLFALIQPLLQADWSEMLRSYEDWRADLTMQSEAYQKSRGEELIALIAEKTAAYIEEKAMAMGVVCHAQVDCEDRDGVPFPAAVTLDIPYEKLLSELIEKELDISPENQNWQEVAA